MSLYLPPGWAVDQIKSRERPHRRPKMGDRILIRNLVFSPASSRAERERSARLVGGIFEVRREVSSLRKDAFSVWRTDLRYHDLVDTNSGSLAVSFADDWHYVMRVKRDSSQIVETLVNDGEKGEEMFYVHAIRVKNGYKGQVLARNKGTTVQDISTDLIVWESGDTFTDDDTVEPPLSGRVMAERAAQNRINKFLVDAFRAL